MNHKVMTYLICFSAFALLIFFYSCKSKNGKETTGELQYGFSKASDSIRYDGNVLNNVDAQSFEILDEYYCKDKNHVFYHRAYRESSDYFISKKHSIQQLTNADAATFVSLGYGYGKDKLSAWCNNQSFEVSDVQSLIAIDFQFVKDKKRVYLQCKMIPNSHGQSFERINSFYAKDAQQYFFIYSDQVEYTLKTIACNYPTYELLDYTYSKDNQHVFYNGEKIKGAKSESFQIIKAPYSKDNQSVFYQNKIITDAHPNTFELFTENESSSGETYYAKDKNSIFVNNMAFGGADAATFKILDEKYCMDKNGIYYRVKKVKNADPATFKVFPHYMGDADAQDKNHKYGDGKVVE